MPLPYHLLDNCPHSKRYTQRELEILWDVALSPMIESIERSEGLGAHKTPKPTVEELLSPQVMRIAARIKREIMEREAPEMEARERATRLTEQDYEWRANC